MATKIDPGQAQSLIQEFRTQNKAAGEHALKTSDGQDLNGFFLDRESLETILKDPKVAGIHLHLAKNTANATTAVYSGSERNEQGASKPFTSTGAKYSADFPCPPWCD